MPLPSLQDDLAEIRANAAQARGDEALAPMMSGGAGGKPSFGVDLQGAGEALAESPVAKVGQALAGTTDWVRKLPANLSKGALDAVVATGRGMWDGLRQSIEEQFVDDKTPGMAEQLTPAERREFSEELHGTKRDPSGFPIDLKRPAIQNPDGSYSTERTITVGFDDRYYNIPTIWDGKELSPEEAIARARKGLQAGAVYPNFSSNEEAVRAAPLRSASIDTARTLAESKVPEIALDEQAGIAYDNWRRSISEDDTLADSLTQGIAQFTVPFLSFSKAFGVTSAATKIGMFARGAAAEGAAVYTAFDPASGRMADLLDLGRHAEGKFGDTMRTLAPDDSLTNQYINWMTDRTGETGAEGRFKNVLDNLAVSAAAAGLLKTAGTTFKTAREFAQRKIEAPIPPAPKSEVKPAQSGFAETHSGLVFKDEKDAASTVEELAHQFGPGFEQRQADAWAKSSDKNFATLHSFANVLRANADKPVSTHSLVTALEKNIKGDTETGAFYKELLGRLKEKNLGGMTVVASESPGTARGGYVPKANAVKIYERAFESPEKLLHTFTHEAVHAATVREVRESAEATAKITRLFKQAQEALNKAAEPATTSIKTTDVTGQYRELAAAAPGEPSIKVNDIEGQYRDAAPAGAAKAPAKTKKHYAFTDPEEFIAEIESNPEFRKLMKETKIDGESAWDKYRKAIGGILGIGALALSPEFDKLMDPKQEQEAGA